MKPTHPSQPSAQPLLDQKDASAMQHEDAVRCCDYGWPAFWVLVIASTIATIITYVMTPDLSVEYFNGGSDPCIGVGKGSQECTSAVEKSNNVLAVFNLISGILCFFTAPLVGAVADVTGPRKMLMLFSTLSVLVACSFIAVVIFRFPIYTFFFMSEIQSLVPGLTLFQLYCAAAAPPNSRAQVFGRLTAAVAMEGVVAPLMALFISHDAAAIVVGFLGVVSFVTTCAFLVDRPASAPSCEGRDDNSKGLLQHFRDRFSLSQATSVLRLFNNRATGTMAFLAIIGNITNLGINGIFLFYVKMKYGMNYQQVAPLLSVSTLSTCLVNVFLVGPATRMFGLRNTAIFAFAIGIPTCLIYALAPSPSWLYVASSLSGLVSLASPAILSLFTNIVSEDQDGVLGVTIGSLTSLTSISQIIGPTLYRVLFMSTISPSALFPEGFPSSPFFLGIATDIVAIALLRRIPDISAGATRKDVAPSHGNDA